MKKWVYMPKLMVAMDIPDYINMMPEGCQKDIKIERYISEQVMQHVEVTEYKEGEYNE